MRMTPVLEEGRSVDDSPKLAPGVPSLVRLWLCLPFNPGWPDPKIDLVLDNRLGFVLPWSFSQRDPPLALHPLGYIEHLSCTSINGNRSYCSKYPRRSGNTTAPKARSRSIQHSTLVTPMLRPYSTSIPTFSKILLLTAFIALSGCNQGTEIAPVDLTPSPTPIASATQTATATPEIPTVLFVPSGGKIYHVNENIRTALVELTEREGWIVAERTTLSESGLPEQTRVVVFLETDGNIPELVSNHPQIHFIAIGIEGIQAQPNLSIIGPTGFRLDQQAFLGGYLAAVLTNDWRIGSIIDLPENYRTTVEIGFGNGMRFYCGLCLMAFPPFIDYPIQTMVDGSTDQRDWNSSVEAMKANVVETVFIIGEDVDEEAVDELVQGGVQVIGIDSPPDTLLPGWIATVRFAPELVIAEKWEEIVSMEGGWSLSIPLILDDINPTLFSQGRQDFVNRTLSDLLSGLIDPAVTPPASAQGE